MSLTTRCPACETVFKVIPDQLRVSSGWVRCGRCAEVFDAATHMLASSDTGMQTPVPPRVVAQPRPSVSSKEINQAAAATRSPTPAATPSADITGPVTRIRQVSTDDTARLQSELDLKQVPELSFVRHAKSKAFWQHPQVVRALMASLLILTGLLASQIVLDQRNLIAAKFPGLQSTLSSMCAPLGCTIEPVKQLDALKIDSSTFQKIQESALGETFALKVTLKNNATLPLAVPALELTLTDASDKPVMRRVILPPELGFQDKTLAASGEWNASQSIFVSANTDQNRKLASVTGYRVLAFYP